ncbi:hypothetical protein [Bdellovibrio sp. HCB337]|uniref:hypothetical protein n=1 Tax=Bdellovibrio sp. HCB337 TaxID=3394358 RepID=UPI0039A63331
MKRNTKLIILGAVGLTLAFYVQKLLQDAGAFRQITPVAYGQCQKVGNLLGPEDFALLQNGKVIISAEPRDGGEGDLHVYDPVQRVVTKLKPEPELEFDFRPHGIDVFETAERTLVYAVNHRTDFETTVEVFEYRGDKLLFLKTLIDPFFQSGNDIAVLSEDRFYLTSDFGTPRKPVQKVTQYLRHATGYVSFFDGKKADLVIPSVFYANGLTLNTAKTTLFVAGMLEKTVRVYDISSGKPQYVKTLHVDGGPDNIRWAHEKLFVAAHPKLLTLKQESEDRAIKAPSQIIEYSDLNAKESKSIILYANQGDEISSASIAMPLEENRLLIGSVFDNQILDCKK